VRGIPRASVREAPGAPRAPDRWGRVTMSRRAFLLLQGVCSPFFARLADELEAAGHAVLKLNFNAGDALHWGRRRSWHFRGSLADLGEFLEARYRCHGVTDQVMF